MTGNRVIFPEKMRYEKLKQRSLFSELESEIFIRHEASKRVTFISQVIPGCLAPYSSVRGIIKTKTMESFTV